MIATVTVLNMLHGNTWINGSLEIEKGEGCSCSLSQFKNELRQVALAHLGEIHQRKINSGI